MSSEGEKRAYLEKKGKRRKRLNSQNKGLDSLAQEKIGRKRRLGKRGGRKLLI